MSDRKFYDLLMKELARASSGKKSVANSTKSVSQSVSEYNRLDKIEKNIKKTINKEFPNGPPSPTIENLPIPDHSRHKKRKEQGTEDDPIVLYNESEPIELKSHDYPIENLNMSNKHGEMYPIELDSHFGRETLGDDLNSEIENAETMNDLFDAYHLVQLGSKGSEGVCSAIAKSFLHQMKVPVEAIISKQDESGANIVTKKDYVPVDIGNIGPFKQTHKGSYKIDRELTNNEREEIAEKLEDTLSESKNMVLFTSHSRGDKYSHVVCYDPMSNIVYDPNYSEPLSMQDLLKKRDYKNLDWMELHTLKPEHRLSEKDRLHPGTKNVYVPGAVKQIKYPSGKKLYSYHPDIGFGLKKRKLSHK